METIIAIWLPISSSLQLARRVMRTLSLTDTDSNFTLDRSRDVTSYWKCCLHKSHTCRARITAVDKQLTSPIPQHTHDVQHAEATVHVAEQNLKGRAAIADLPTKFLCAEPEAVSEISFEARSKLGCQIKSLKRMAQRSRQAANRHPANPRDLEQLSLPADYVRANSGEPLLLWDSGFSAQTRRSFLFETPDNTTALHDAEHLILDGTFKFV